MRRGLSLIAAFAVLALLATALAPTTVRAQQPADLTREQKQMVVDCGAVYRWQGGADDPSYKKIKSLFDRFSKEGPKVNEQTMSINRDAFERSVASGKLTSASMEKWLASCADFLGLPAPPGPVRPSAFPETPAPDMVAAMLDCLALSRWAMGPDAYFFRVSRERYVTFARLTDEPAADAEIKRRTENIDKALKAGVGSLTDLAAAQVSCQNDYHILITGLADRKMSFEYEQAHPAPLVPPPSAFANTTPAPATPPSVSGRRPTASALWSGERLYTSGGVDVTDTVSSAACVAAMDEATARITPDLSRLTQAMERDKSRYCPDDEPCHFESNGVAIVACASINQARGGVPSECLKERAILDNLREKVCPQS